MSFAYYNEFDPFCADWLLELMADGLIAPGIVDRRSIVDVLPSDLKGFTQCHFFAGIGIWSLAARLAGWSDDRPIWTGSAPCFPADTLILTKRGQVPIQDVIVGDEVFTHEGRYRRVLKWGADESQLVRLKGQGHAGLLTTADHPFYSRADKRVMKRSDPNYSKIVLDGTPEWTDAAHMEGLRWAGPAAFPIMQMPLFSEQNWRGKKPNLPPAPSAIAFAKFLGYWTGDGWVTGSKVVLCGAHGHGSMLREMVDNAGLTGYLNRERTTDRLTIGSKVLVEWLIENFGKGASTKKIPAWLHGMPDDFRESFLSGWMLADGHVSHQSRGGGKVQSITTVSKALAVGARILFNQQRMSASMTFHQPNRENVIEGRMVGERGFYKVTAYMTARSLKFDDLHAWGKVRRVEETGIRAKVFNLEVEGDNSYVADGIVVHNCQPFSAAGKAAGFDDERHLWPAWFHLIERAKPAHVPLIGEQVASKDGRTWLDLVFNDMEGLGHACGALDTCAAGLGAPFIGQRLYWLAATDSARLEGHRRSGRVDAEAGREVATGHCATAGTHDGMGATNGTGLQQGREGSEATRYGCPIDAAGGTDGMASTDSGKCNGRSIATRRDDSRGLDAGRTESDGRPTSCGENDRMASPDGSGPLSSALSGIHSGENGTGSRNGEPERPGEFDSTPDTDGSSGIPLHPVDYWRDAEWLLCRDPNGPRFRPVESASLIMADVGSVGGALAPSSGARQTHFPLTEKNTYVNRLNEIRGAGNALNVAQASTFIECVMEYLAE